MRKPLADYVRLLRRLVRMLQGDLGAAYGNPERVDAIATTIAVELKLPRRTVAFVEAASLLHDVGKLAIPESILLKPGALSSEERSQVEAHLEESISLVAKLQVPDEVLTIVSQHHERFDGSGYPLGLKASEIHIGARVLAVANVFEALTADRPYRKAHPLERVIEIVKEAAGSDFDPVVVDALLSCISRRRGNIL